MNKVSHKKFLLITVFAFLFLFGTITPAIFDGDAQLESQITITTEINDISLAEIDGVKKEVRVALNIIPQILGINYNAYTKINIVDKGICYAEEGTVSLSIPHVRDNSAPIIHEVSHILTNHKYNSFFSEGLAVYFQERFGGNSSFPNFSAPLDESVRNHKGHLLKLSQLNNDNRIFGQVGTELRRIAYLQAGSFFNFLVEKYGVYKLADLNNSRTLNYEKVYGKEINELEEEWKSYVFENSNLTKI